MPEPYTLAQAKADLGALLSEGTTCPCCGQFAKVYKRKLHSAMARDLILAYRRAGTEWFHVRQVLGHDGGDFAKLAMWDLIEEAGERRPDGGRAGWWQITESGVLFVSGLGQVSKYARVYNGRRINLTGPLVTIEDCLGERFNYHQLMHDEQEILS